MKKLLLPLLMSAAFYNQSQACAWYDPDYDYFNLFTQSIIRDKSYTPFLMTYSNPYYSDSSVAIPDENIESWQKFFGNQLNYKETDHLVKHITLTQLNQLKAGQPTEPLLKKLGTGFYNKYKEAIDYLIEAKYLEPYMRINYIETADSFYYRPENQKNATNLDYEKTIGALNSLYHAAQNPEIKQRYGYQLVRFNHYTRNYDQAIETFKTKVEPLKLKNSTYFLALDQYAGALHGNKNINEANWNFFQVLKNTKYRKADAYSSLKLGDSTTFNNLLKRAHTTDDKTMAYFLLGYQDFNNPLGSMEKIYDIDPNSEALKVLAARAINELERDYLPTSYYSNGDSTEEVQKSTSNTKTSNSTKDEKIEAAKPSIWQRIVNFFKNLWGDSKDETTERSNNLSDKSYLNNKNRIPFLNTGEYDDGQPNISKDYLSSLEEFTEKVKKKNSDEFWSIAQAYLKFLNKDYEGSTDILENLKTNNTEYKEQIARMLVLNDIVSQPKITAEFEAKLMSNYKDYFVEKPKAKDSATNEEHDYYEDYKPNTKDFLNDILANRYFLQGEDAKSFLMSNKLSDLRYDPNLDLAQKLQAFYNKKDKTTFEQQIVEKQMNDVGDVNAYFNLMYGDDAMRKAQFEKALGYYKQAQNFKGFELPTEYYDYNVQDYVKNTDTSSLYDGFRNVDSYIFGHNVMESYQSPTSETMQKENFANEFTFIKNKMNKIELAQTAMELQKLGKGTNTTAANANQLIGNLLYNTSVLGYFREVFSMDTDNSNGGKFHFGVNNTPYKYYYKNYINNVYWTPDNFDVSLDFYSKALKTSNDAEQKARILFQMASVEQGKFYQYEASNTPEIDYDDENWSEKRTAALQKMEQLKQQKYKTYFTQLKTQYRQTKVSDELMGSCSYYKYFLTK